MKLKTFIAEHTLSTIKISPGIDYSTKLTLACQTVLSVANPNPEHTLSTIKISVEGNEFFLESQIYYHTNRMRMKCLVQGG